MLTSLFFISCNEMSITIVFFSWSELHCVFIGFTTGSILDFPQFYSAINLAPNIFYTTLINVFIYTAASVTQVGLCVCAVLSLIPLPAAIIMLVAEKEQVAILRALLPFLVLDFVGRNETRRL